MMSCGDWDAHLGLRRGRGATSTEPGHLRKPSLVARIWRQNGEKQQAFSAHEKQATQENNRGKEWFCGANWQIFIQK